MERAKAGAKPPASKTAPSGTSLVRFMHRRKQRCLRRAEGGAHLGRRTPSTGYGSEATGHFPWELDRGWRNRAVPRARLRGRPSCVSCCRALGLSAERSWQTHRGLRIRDPGSCAICCAHGTDQPPSVLPAQQSAEPCYCQQVANLQHPHLSQKRMSCGSLLRPYVHALTSRPMFRHIPGCPPLPSYTLGPVQPGKRGAESVDWFCC